MYAKSMDATYSIHLDSKNSHLTKKNIRKLKAFAEMRMEGSLVITDVMSIFFCKKKIPEEFSFDEGVKAHGIVTFFTKFANKTKSKFHMRIICDNSECYLIESV